jgi:hypothetical protein
MARAVLVGVALAVTTCSMACVNGTAPIDLYRADTKVLRVALKNPRSAICPGEPVPLDIELDALVDGDMIHLKQRRFDLDDRIFEPRQLHLSSAQGFFGENGSFYPNPDVTASAQTGFVFFVRAPHGPAFSVRFPPSYECTAMIGAAGRYGAPGKDGEDAIAADRNADVVRGEDPDAAAWGHTAQDGGQGGEGPRFAVYVTWVRTPDYTKLLAARSFGDVQRLTLVAPGTPLTVRARGGQGGTGGRGGQGGRGLMMGTSANGRAIYGAGARGGTGGTGGMGGSGGDVDVYIDDRFDDLERMVVADVEGGPGGPGGQPGRGGDGGRPSGFTRGTEGSLTNGPPGAPGGDGKRGAAGRARIARADVRAQFDGLGAVVPY